MKSVEIRIDALFELLGTETPKLFYSSVHEEGLVFLVSLLLHVFRSRCKPHDYSSEGPGW